MRNSTGHWWDLCGGKKGRNLRSGDGQRRLEAKRGRQPCWTTRLWRQTQLLPVKRKGSSTPFPSRTWCFRSMLGSPSLQTQIPLLLIPSVYARKEGLIAESALLYSDWIQLESNGTQTERFESSPQPLINKKKNRDW